MCGTSVLPPSLHPLPYAAPLLQVSHCKHRANLFQYHQHVRRCKGRGRGGEREGEWGKREMGGGEAEMKGGVGEGGSRQQKCSKQVTCLLNSTL